MPDYLKTRGYPYNPRQARLLRSLQAEPRGNNKPVFEYEALPQQTWLEVVADQQRQILYSRRRTDRGGRRYRIKLRLRRSYKAMGYFTRSERVL